MKPEDLTPDTIKQGLKDRGLRVADISRFSGLNRKNIYNSLTDNNVSSSLKCIFFLVFALCDVSPEFKQKLLELRPKK